MNRQTRTFIVLFVAVVAAALASFGVYRAISSIPERRVEIATTHAVVAAAPLPLGALLTKESVKLVAWPEKTPLEGGFDSIEQVLERGLVSSVSLNEPITENKLAPKGAGAGPMATPADVDVPAPPEPHPILTPAGSFRDVSRGNPKPHSLTGDALTAARLTPESWRLEVVVDPFTSAAVPQPAGPP